MKKYLILALMIAGSCLFSSPGPAALGNENEPRFAKRWFYASFNLLVDEHAARVIALIDRAGKSGFNGMVLADYKLNVLQRLPKHYFQNLARVQKAAEKAGVEIIPAVCPIGYSEGILTHDPNLAEGVPVKGAPFLVKNGKVVLDSQIKMRNGDLEETRGDDRFVGFSFQDDPGKSTYADRAVVHHGKVSCRMEQLGKHNKSGNCRLVQRVQVRPFGCYRFSAWVKSKDLKPAGNFRLLVNGASDKGIPLTFFEESLKATEDWKKVEVVFNSLGESEVSLWAGIWTGKAGTLWIDDLRLEEIPLANVLRRDGCPLVITSADGKNVYEEGKDFHPVHDPVFTKHPGHYDYFESGPEIKLTAGSRIKEGDKLLVSWYHPILTHSYQVTCCLSEPKVFDIVRDQIRRVNEALKPKTFFMSHDEIRVANWCKTCQDRKQTPGDLLADNVRQCVKIIEEANPKAEIVVWSDMFDPHHNAVKGPYYLVNGPLTGSWDGLPKRVHLANWNGGGAGKSLKWFAERGHSQIVCGFYDEAGPDSLKNWVAAARGVRGVDGFMYTTWQHNFEHLEAYGKALLAK